MRPLFTELIRPVVAASTSVAASVFAASASDTAVSTFIMEELLMMSPMIFPAGHEPAQLTITSPK
jgi:hypothetical protein